MDGLRVVSGDGLTARGACSRCGATGCPWDRIGEQAVCPDCQEQLALGEGDPLIERLRPRRCAVCGQGGIVPYLTYPLHAQNPLEVDLCPQHFHALLGRRLDRHAHAQLARQLRALGLTAHQVFLLHEAFYDEHGQPLQPVRIPDA
jgi:hypothetical protein